MKNLKFVNRVETHTFEICMAGDIEKAKLVCHEFVNRVGLCVTLTPTDYIYTNGSEKGFFVRLINYPRFPSNENDLYSKAVRLAEQLLKELDQGSYSIIGKDFTHFHSYREADLSKEHDHDIIRREVGELKHRKLIDDLTYVSRNVIPFPYTE